MNIVQPYAKLHTIDGNSPELTSGILALKKIEWCGRISHRSEESQTIDSYDRFIRTVVLGHGDWSIVEHASATVDMLVDRGSTHEVVRHRLFSFTQESTRFVNYEKKMPPSFTKPEELQDDDVPRDNVGNPTDCSSSSIWSIAIEACEDAYRELLRRKFPPQIARSIFPNALASRVI